MIQKGLNVNTLCTSIDSNLLTICVYLDNYKCVKLLLENGADPSIKNKHNYSASFYSNNKQIVELFDKFSKKNESITLRLFKKEKSVEEIRMFLKYHTPSKQEFFHILVYIVTKNLSNYIDLLKEFDVHLSQFENEFNKYVNSTDLGRTFNYKYSPYRDIKKTALDAIKQLHPSLSQYDIPFEIVNGRVNTKVIADAMKRYKIEGISEQQINQAITASLSADDLNQMRIDANYQFRNYTPQDLVNHATQQYSILRKQTEDALAKLEQSLPLTKQNPTESAKIQNSIAYYKQLLGKDGVKGILKQNYENDVENALNNPDGVKYNIYKNGFISELGNAFKWENKVEEVVANPYKAQENWLKDFNQRESHFRQEQSLREKEFDWKVESFKLEHPNLFGNSVNPIQYGDETTKENMALENFGNFVGETQASRDQFKKLAMGTTPSGQPYYTEEQFNKAVADLKKNGNLAGSTLGPEALTALRGYIKASDQLEALQKLDKQNRALAEKLVGANNTLSDIFKNRKNVTFTYGGKVVTLTPSELAGIVAAESTHSEGEGVSSISIDKSKLNANQLSVVKMIENERYGVSNPFSKKSDFYKKVENLLYSYEQPALSIKDLETKIQSKQRELLSPYIKQFIPDGTKVYGVKCENCGGTNVVYEGGCSICKDCGSSRCS